MKKRFIFIILLFVLPLKTFGQVYFNAIELSEKSDTEAESFVINRIEIAGNEKTKDYIILRELHFTTGDSIDVKGLYLAQKRLLNLFLFNRVVFDIIGTPDEAMLLITVTELWYIFPVPIMYLNERSWDKISYGAKFNYYNFLGRSILLKTVAAFGYNPEYRFSYRNPWFGGDLKLLTTFTIYKKRVRTKSLEFERESDRRAGFEWTIGRRFGHHFYTMLTFGYLEIDHRRTAISPDGKDELPIYSLGLLYDNRDLIEYPHRGFNLLFWAKRVKNRSPIDYWQYGADLRGYIPLPAYTTLALRTSCSLSEGRIPIYDRVYLGYYEKIRGQFNRKFEGENLVISSAELRIPLMKIRYLDLTRFAFPGFERYYYDLKFGLSAALFYDIGAVWFQNESLRKDALHTGFGAGLHLHLPYVDLMRLEIGFDPDFNHEYIAEVELAF
ncbi:MAG: BamA/TamA family outer membrane protein [candidate division KSB1 bacterium]|jgi:outer membrane protein assembly factor BamA|nr:BamA/TamA family outer membrane protein [candidate division KSB1 bacterium]